MSIIGSVTSAILGTLKSFTANYYSFLLFEFFESVASSGVYAAIFVLGKESNPHNHKICVFLEAYF